MRRLNRLLVFGILLTSLALTDCSSDGINGTDPDGDQDGSDGVGCENDTGEIDTDEIDDDIKPNFGFVSISAGTFWMGSPQSSICPDGYPGVCSGEYSKNHDERLRLVHLTFNFELGKYEVTQGEFESLMNYNPSNFSKGGGGLACGANCPVETVTWYEALAYANALSVSKDLPECFDCSGEPPEISSCTLKSQYRKPQECEGYRLPTEAEWEYAIRVGNQYTAFYQGVCNNGTIRKEECAIDENLEQIGWYCGNSNDTTHPVGQKEANAWGLYDMSGNVSEWTWDVYQNVFESDEATNPVGEDWGSFRVERGGSWANFVGQCRSAERNERWPERQFIVTGFRVARTLFGSETDNSKKINFYYK